MPSRAGAGADVAPGHEPRAYADAECPPPRRADRLRLGRAVLDLARDRRTRLGAGGGAGGARRRQGRPRPGSFQELRRDVLVDVRGLSARRGLGADEFPPDAGRGRLSRHRLRREGIPVPRRLSRSCQGRGGNPALEFIWRIGEGAFGERSVGEAIADHAGARVENVAVDYDDPCWFFFTSGTTGRSKAAVLTHGQMGFVVTNHLADLMPGTTEQRCLAGGRAAVAWRRRASTRAGRARRADRFCCRRKSSTSRRRSG